MMALAVSPKSFDGDLDLFSVDDGNVDPRIGQEAGKIGPAGFPISALDNK
jgi:hypothetical protein